MEGSEHYKPGVEVGGGRFKVIKKLGEGGMGVVCLAEDTMLGENLALKFLSPQLGHDEEAMDDMRRETRKSRQLSHPNIVRIHDIYHLPGEAPFISMEVIQGQSLSALKAEQIDRLFPWPYLEPIVAQMCDALDYAHGEKIVHRDLKPANMIIDAKGRLKIADFGLAATISDSMVKVSKDMGVSGTPSYMGPQQLAGKPSKATDDVYSLGATIYELLTSKPPFYKGDVLNQIREVDPPNIQERLEELGLENEVSLSVSRTIMACLEKDPAKRPQSAGEVAELMGIAPASASRRSVRGDPNAAVPLDSPEATEMLSRRDIDNTPKEKPQFTFTDGPSNPGAPPSTPRPKVEPKTTAPNQALSEEYAQNEEDQETIAPGQPLPGEYSATKEMEEVVEEYESEDDDGINQPAVADMVGGKGKLYAIIGGVAALLLIGLIAMFSRGGDKKADEQANATNPDKTKASENRAASPAIGKSPSLESLGFISLIDAKILSETEVRKEFGNKREALAPPSSFAKNILWKQNKDSLVGTVETTGGPEMAARAKLTFAKLPINGGVELGMAFEIEGVGAGPTFSFSLPDNPKERLMVLYSVASNDSVVKIGRLTQTLKPHDGPAPASMEALWQELKTTAPKSIDGTTVHRVALRCDGKSILLRSSESEPWMMVDKPDSEVSELFAEGPVHFITFTDASGGSARTLTLHKYLMRSLKIVKLPTAPTVVFEDSLGSLEGFVRQQSANEANFGIDSGALRIIGERGPQARYGVRRLPNNLKPGQHYRLTIEMKTAEIEKSVSAGRVGASAGFTWRVADKLGGSYVFAPTGSADWQTKTVLFQLPEDAVAQRLALRLNASAGTAWFRNLKIEELPE